MDAKVVPGPGANGRVDVATAANNASRHSIQSVDRALLLLETIADMGGEATLTELANRTRLNISTCHHLLATLIKRNFVAKVPGKRLYALGGRILYIGHACLQVDLPRRAQPYLENINLATGETVHLAGLAGRRHLRSLGARSASRRARRDRQARQDRCAACAVDGQGDRRLAAGRRDPPHRRQGPQEVHREYHHRL